MPRYYLNIHNSHSDTTDEEGRTLPGLDAARRDAIDGIRSFLGHELCEGKLDLRGHIDVVDGAGRTLLTVPFADAVQVIVAGDAG